MDKSLGLKTFLVLFMVLIASMGLSSDLGAQNPARPDQSDDEEIVGKLDILLQDPYLSFKYTKGSYLLYDCFDQHWVCTSKFEYKSCTELRKILIKDRAAKLNCSPVKRFATEKACKKAQRQLVTRKMGIRTCIHPDIQKQFKGR